MIMPGIELSVIPRIDISTRVTGVTNGKEGYDFDSVAQIACKSNRKLRPDPCLPLDAKTPRRCRVRGEFKVGEGNVMENAS
ncbi:hypothetical protein ALC57_06708 [Trachymyrmex cornetzi]|uniref:Uncharacterized protein n=1 Tax=Trachymyrmex cornetzi TaxID=471704 RepID=A0A195E7G9_9HYME|nr:hypothetical protein ALC57_06708 [Trachymyrmex cornetzi]